MAVRNDGPRSRSNLPSQVQVPARSALRTAAKTRTGKRVRLDEHHHVQDHDPADPHSDPKASVRKPLRQGVEPTPNAAERRGCWSEPLPDGKHAVMWPNNQRYEGHLDASGNPHGAGLLQLASGAWFASRWSHGACIEVDGKAAVPAEVRVYQSGPVAPRGQPVVRRISHYRIGDGDAADAAAAAAAAQASAPMPQAPPRTTSPRRGAASAAASAPTPTAPQQARQGGLRNNPFERLFRKLKP